MKKVLTGMLCVSSIAATAQEKGARFNNTVQEPMAVISVKLDQAPNDSLVNLYEPYSGDTATAYVKNHQFELRMPMKKGGSVYILQIGSNPTEQNGMGTILYLEDGKMQITGKGAGFNDAKFSGNPWVKEWQEVMAITDPYSGEGLRFAQLEKQYHEAVSIGDEDAMNVAATEATAVEKSMQSKLKSWVAKHPNSGVCGYILTVYFTKEPKYVDSVYETLGDHAKASRILQRYKNPGKVDEAPLKMSMGEGAPAPDMGRVKIGTAAPDFTIPDLAGKKISLSAFKGKYVFLDFWASWCSPCIAQIPHLQEINNEFKDKNFLLMAISLDSKQEGWEKAVQKHGLTWLNVSNLKGWGEPVAGLYGVRYLPSNVLIDPAGNVVAYDLYGEALKAKLNELIK
ncbi:TlpA disulfide reductase family protein [Chitinophaga sp.]|uniref:TlpA disulfide reductase family protein n=1 Tax=Chitinophaga sp. TaxID=1869181 RepID=UPI00260D7103|nr:TlpA disulfide reductase family protein [uncultured Chitinophaga sp.]